MAKDSKRVVGVGLACLDQLLIWEDTAVAVQDNRIVDADMQGGGMAATAMVAVNRLGGQAELWACVGDDWVGEQIVHALDDDGVDTAQMTKIEGGRSLFIVVCVDKTTGERHFKVTGEWDRPTKPLGDLSRLANADCLLIDHAHPDSELLAAKEAQRLGIPVVSDTGRFAEWQEVIMTHVTYAIASEEAASQLSDNLEEACRRICKMGAKVAVVTLGNKGLISYDGSTFLRLPAFNVKVVDTTGAGDVFHGAFCYGLTQGFPLQDNLLFSSATSALKCGKIGGRAGIPERHQVEEFLAQQKKSG